MKAQSAAFDFDDVLERMAKSAAKCNVDRVRQEDIVRTGRAAEEAE